jgi:hypothetical protein
LAGVSGERWSTLFGDVVVRHLPWRKRGRVAVVDMHEVGLTCREGLVRFL